MKSTFYFNTKYFNELKNEFSPARAVNSDTVIT